MDGPWRVSARFRVAVLAEVGDLGAAAVAARLGHALAEAGHVPAEIRAVPPGGMRLFLHQSASTGTDALILDARTVMAPSAVTELRRVADTDPMIAAVLPHFTPVTGNEPEDAAPAVGYTLLPDRRCAYLKASVLADFGEPWTPGGGEDDLVGPLLALNRFGFRVAVAGRARVAHPEGSSPPDDAALPPGWRPTLVRHRSSAPSLAKTLMEGLRPGPDGRQAIAFDLSHAGPSHSGTTLLARALVGRAAALWNDLSLHVVARPETFAFHFGDLAGTVTHVDPSDSRVFSALIRFGQPFLWGEIDAAVRRAPVLVLFMLDTIGLDCERDAPDELDALWRFCLAEADGVLFNSAFTKRQFARRFALRPDMPARPSPHSLDLADYRLAGVADAPEGGGILVIGNAMPHKRLRETATLLASAGPSRPVTVLGLEPGAIRGVETVASGSVPPERMAALYAAARVVVYPSVYEGFGFPILDALAHRRPILVRPLPPYAEIAAGLPERANIHAFADDAELLRLLENPPVWTDERAEVPARTWDDAAGDLRSVLDAALANPCHARVVRRIDMLRGRMSFMRLRALGNGDDAVADDLDRVAGLAGRLVQGCVLWIGRRVPGLRTLIGAAHRFWSGRQGRTTGRHP